MDVRDANGYSIWIPLEQDQCLDFWPDSEEGIEAIRELEPHYEDIVAYYTEHVHSEWLVWNPDQSLQSGIASFWAYIVDRQIRLRGVPTLWKRYRILVKAGQGLIIKNRMLHAGAPHSGGAVFRIHMYMSEEGKLLSEEIGDSRFSDRVYDFRTDEVYFPMATYLEAGSAGWIDMTRSC
jgi:hypothetical protein